MSETCKENNGDVWEIYKDASGEWRWRCTSSTGRIVGASKEGYKNKSDCIANAKRPGMKCTPS